MNISRFSIPIKPLRVLTVILSLAPIFAASDAGAVESSKVKSLFQEPPREYSTGPLWVWNDRLTEAEVRGTLRDLAEQKVKQVWVHPRPGLMTPYLSAEWFQLWKVALDEARRLDMNVWIYDENSYPSGFAGGWVPELLPESRGRGLTFQALKRVPAWSDAMVGVYGLEGTTITNLTQRAKAGESLPEGNYQVATEVRAGNDPWHGNRSYVNLLSPGVTEKFLEVTLGAYRREVGSEFGRRVPGVFTDEPNIRPVGGFAWSENLAAEFQKRWGYNLLEQLPSLNRPVGSWQRVRHNYYQVLNEQFIEHWSRPYHDFCETNRLDWTGHYWDHEWPNCGAVPDNMSMYAWHQRPAIDCLMNQYAENTHAQFGNARMVRELSSVANQLGMKRTLCEVYGAGGWDLRFEDMKRIGDWLEVLGVNTLNQHLSYVTLRGARKRDHPQSFSYHEPWWEAYHLSAEYLARVSTVLSQGEQINPILVLEPTTTAWMYQGDGAKLKEIGDSFFSFVMGLETAQVEYDLGCEDVMARHGAIENGELKIGRRRYATVVLPPFTENLNERTLNLLARFEEAGGSLICCGDAPSRVDGTPRAGLTLARSPHWKPVEPNRLIPALPRSELAITRVEGDQGLLFHHRRQIEDGEFLFLVNTSITAPSAGAIQRDLKGVERWNLYTGQVETYPFESTAHGIKASFTLPPSGSLLLFLSRKTTRSAPPMAETVTVIRAGAPPEIRTVGPNVLTLDYVDISAGGESRTNVYFYQANQFAWQKNGEKRNPWDSAVQFKDELIAKTFPPTSGFEASYRFNIAEAVPADLAIVIERSDLYAVTCNGQPVKASTGHWWLDRAFDRIDIASLAKVGQNRVTIKASPFTMYHELEAAYILGSFSLRPAESGFVITRPKPLQLAGEPGQSSTNRFGWNLQGYPFYSAGVSYRESFPVDKASGQFHVALTDWYGSVAKVIVNGKPAGYIDAPPWECDVTPWVRQGKNEIEVTVIGTLKNTLGPHHGNPVLGAAWPASFQRGADPGPPPGDRYSTVAYGLFEPFVLRQSVRR